MQKFILKNKNNIALVLLALIVGAFVFKFAFNNEIVFMWLMITASVIGVLPILIQAIQALRFKVISIEVLVVIAVIGAFIIKNYEESAIVTFLFLFGAFLELKTLNKTREAIKKLTMMAPENALKKIGDEFVMVDVDDVDVGDLLLVKTGSKIPVDGVVVDGSGYINEASITGESVQAFKENKSFVYAGTILENGTLYIVAEKVGEDTTFGKIIELVEEAQDSKSKAEKFIDKFARYYTPAVLLIGLVVGLITKNIELAVTILVLGCPGALVIGVPVSNVAGIGNGAKHGILLKGSETINDFSKIDTMIFDKTGTLTIGKPEVAEIFYYTSNKEQALDYLNAVEKESDHPLATAITTYISKPIKYRIDQTDIIKGKGIKAVINDKVILIGSESLIEKEIQIKESILNDINKLKETGHSLVIMAVDEKIELVVGIKDQIRSDVLTNLNKLKKMGVKEFIILSGDNQGAVDLVAKELKITNAHGNMLPSEKADYIKTMQQNGHIIAFVGDGINDSPSLAVSQIGISMGSGTDVAIETSDVVLMNSDFNKLPHALGLVKKTSLNMIENIIIALGVVALLLAGLLFGNWVSMSIGMFVHEASILVVILNGMRLLIYPLKREVKR